MHELRYRQLEVWDRAQLEATGVVKSN